MRMQRRRRPGAALPPLRQVGGAMATALLLSATVGTAGALAADDAGTPAYGDGIVVDGQRSEWTAGDHFAPMYRAGKASKQVEADLHLRYDCARGVLAVMVETRTSVSLAGGDDFVKIDGRKIVGSPSVGDYTTSFDDRGWEASFALAVGSYDLDVHSQVLDGGSQTAAVDDRSIPLSIACRASQEPGTDPVDDPAPADDPTDEPAPGDEPATDDPTGEPATDDPTGEPGTGPDPSEEPGVEPPTVDKPPTGDPTDEPATDDPAPSDEPTGVPGTGPDPSEEPSVTAEPTPSDEPGVGIDPTPTPIPEPTGDPDPHDQVDGPIGTCDCLSPAPSPEVVDEVLGVVGTPRPTLTPPPTDALRSVLAAPATGIVGLVVAGLASIVAACLILARRRRSGSGSSGAD